MKAPIRAVLAFAMLLSGPYAVNAQSAEALETAGRLVASSGLAVQLKSYPRQMDEELALARGHVPDVVLEALRDAARISFSAEGMEREITQHLAANMALDDMMQTLVWLKSEAGQRMAHAEEEAAANLSPQVLQDYATEYQRNQPSSRRADLIAGLVEATRSVEHSAHAVESIALGVAVGMNAAQPVQNQVGLEQLRSHLQSVLPPEQLREEMAGMMPVLFGYTYRDASDADLTQYLAFNQSPLGNRYNDAVMAAFIEALTRASVSMGPLIEQGLKKKSA